MKDALAALGALSAVFGLILFGVWVLYEIEQAQKIKDLQAKNVRVYAHGERSQEEIETWLRETWCKGRVK